MINKKDRLELESKYKTTLMTTRTSICVAIIATVAALASPAVTYILIGKQTLELDEARLELQKQTASIENARLDLQKQTASIENARLDLQKQTASIENARLDLQKQTTSIDGARLDLQRQIATTSTRNEIKKTEIDDQRRKVDDIRLQNEISSARNALIPVMDMSCNTQRFESRLIRLTCRFKNNGVHRITVTPVQFDLEDSLTRRVIEHGISANIEKMPTNSMPASVGGSNTYDIYLSEKGEKVENQTFLVKVRAQTDLVAVNKLQANARGYISDKDIIDASTQYYQRDAP